MDEENEEKKKEDTLEEKIASKGKDPEEEPKKSSWKGLAVAFAVFAVFIFLIISFSNFSPGFEYRGITGNTIKEGELIFHKISVPTIRDGREIQYNFYLRNNPEKLEGIPFDGEFVFTRDVGVKTESSFNCDGDGTIAMANVVNFYNFVGSEVVNDQNATCDAQGRYTLITIKEGEENKITEVGKACYDVEIKDCDILKVLERFMVEGLVKLKEIEENGP